MSGLRADVDVSRPSGLRVAVDLDVPAGATVALLGPNGAGKSTVVDALSGLAPLDAGSIELGGTVLDAPARDIFVPPERRNVGVVFQRYLLFDHLSAHENVAFGLRARGRARAEALGAARRWLDRLDVGELAERRASELSGGEAQRVAIARALAIEPDLLILDEPLAALDVEVRGALRRTLAAVLAERSGPSVVITHEPTEAFLLADRVVVVERGRVVQRGDVDEIRRRPSTPFVAALAGTNVLRGRAERGDVAVAGAEAAMRTADLHTSGDVIVTISPNAIALHAEEPHGSARNSWRTTIVAIEPLGETARVALDAPFDLVADVTPASVEALGLRPGSTVWAAVKATEVTISPTT